MIAVDSNVFIFSASEQSYFKQPENVQLAKKAKAKLEAALRSKEKLFVPLVVLVEVSNSLIKRMGHEIARLTIERIMREEDAEIGLPSNDELVQAIRFMREKSVGFSDSLIYAMMRARGIRKIITYDDDFKKFEGIEIVR